MKDDPMPEQIFPEFSWVGHYHQLKLQQSQPLYSKEDNLPKVTLKTWYPQLISIKLPILLQFDHFLQPFSKE